MHVEAMIISASVTIISSILLAVALLSYRKFRNSKLGLMATVFLLFLIKGLLLSLSPFTPVFEPLISVWYLWIFDVIILIILYVTSVKR